MSTSTPTLQPTNHTNTPSSISNTYTQEEINAAHALLTLRVAVVFYNNQNNQTSTHRKAESLYSSPDSQATVSAVETITRTPTPEIRSTSAVADRIPKQGNEDNRMGVGVRRTLPEEHTAKDKLVENKATMEHTRGDAERDYGQEIYLSRSGRESV